MTLAGGAVQTSVARVPDLGSAGELYGNGPTDIVSRIAAADIPFGAYVKLVAGGGCDLVASSGNVTASGGGIALKDGSKATGVGYVAGDPVDVLISGRVWINTEDAVTELSVPYARYTAGTFNGATRAVSSLAGASDSGKNVQIVNGRIVKASGTVASTASGLAVLEVGGKVTVGGTGATGATGATGPTGPTGPTG